MLAHVTLNEMEFYAFHGVMEQEQKTGHRFVVTLTVEFDCSEVMISDDVAHTVNYALLHETVRQEMSVRSRLIEHVAGRIAQRILEKFHRVTEVDVQLAKLSPPLPGMVNSASVSIKLRR